MQCARDGCENPTPPGRRKYCSDACSKYVNTRKAKLRQRDRHKAAYRRRCPQAGPRECLRCGKRFDSEGPWNRLCGKCSDDKEREGRPSYSTATLPEEKCDEKRNE